MERIQQVVDSIVKTKYLSNATFDVVAMWSNILAFIVYAVRFSYHSTLHATLGKLVFGRDMLLYVNFKPNYKEMWLRRQKLINNNNKRENAKQVEHDYEVGHYA